jgi:hypothetical protein
MPDRRHINTAMIILACLLVAGTALLFAGCNRIEAIDDAIWGTPSGPVDPNAPELPASAPPILEISAAVLAMFGYGGMAAWIKRSNNTGKKYNEGLQTQVNVLRSEIAALADHLSHGTTPNPN